MSVVFSEHFPEVTKIIQGVSVPTIINAEEEPLLQGPDTREPCKVVFFMEKPLNVASYLNNTLWTSETFFILILEDSGSSEEILFETFQIFWEARVTNVFVLLPSVQNISVFTYRPFAFPECDSIEIVLLDAESKNFTLSNEIRNLHGCGLNVSVVDLPPLAIFPDGPSRQGTFHLDGIEANIIKEICRRLNFVPRFAVARDGEAWGWIHPSPHGVVGEVYLRHSHFGFGLLASTLERYEGLDMTVPVSPLRECITWAVPIGAAKAQALWVEIYVNEFSAGLWVSLLGLFVIMALAFWWISKALGSQGLHEIIIYVYSVFIFVPVKAPNHAALRSLFLSWVWYAFIVMISYQSLMGSKLTVPFRPRDIDTIRDLLESNLQFTGFYNTFRLITYEAEGDLKEVSKRLSATTYGIKEALVYIVVDRNIAYLRETTSFKYFAVHNPQARGKVHFMKECAYQYYPIMVLQKKSPLTKKTNDIITRLFESGILLNWRRRYIYSIIQPSPPAIQLTLNHMLAAFVALLLGIVSSIVVFSMEVLFYHFYKKSEVLQNYNSARSRTARMGNW